MGFQLPEMISQITFKEGKKYYQGLRGCSGAATGWKGLASNLNLTTNIK